MHYYLLLTIQVIIPKFTRNKLVRNYIPPTIKIQRGDTIRWINMDNEPPHLFFLKL